MTASSRDITVVGAGVIGIACARWLQRDGHRVRVLDPRPPGDACSWGNAGVFATDSVIPLATPETLASVPGMLLRSDAPMSLRWRRLPGLLPWLARFVANARRSRLESNARALAQLCSVARESTAALVHGSPAADLVRNTGWLSVFETQSGLTAARRGAEERRRAGVTCEVLGADAVRDMVPEIADHIVGGVHAPDCQMCTDPGGFVARLAADVEADGGRIERQRALRITGESDGVAIVTEDDRLAADHIVVATGVGANELARGIGDVFPVEGERGYHVMLEDARIAPAVPVMAGEHKFVTTAMNRGLRLAGLTELGGRGLPPDPRRIRAILDHAARLFPALQAEEWTEWDGFRSTLPDSLPVIGRSGNDSRVSYAFGHQHLGLTLAGLTGRLIADDLAQRAPPIDTTPLRPERWRGR